MGAQSTDQRTLGRAGGRARRIRRLASCPGEDCPVGAAYPGFRPPRPIARSDVAEMPASLWAVSLSVTGASPFTKVLATTAPTTLFCGHFTFKTAPVRPPGRRPKSLYTGMTVHPVNLRPWPQKGGLARPPKCGMVSPLTAPHTRLQSDGR